MYSDLLSELVCGDTVAAPPWPSSMAQKKNDDTSK